MPVIAPSILSADFANLERDIHDIERSGADWVHVDVMDGMFVPNISIGIPVVKALRPVTSLPLDVHLMISDPRKYAPVFAQAGAQWITFHYEAMNDAQDCRALAKELGPSGVRVNCIAPGVIDTRMMDEHSDETKAALAEETPLCRLGTPQDVAGACAFLLSDAAAFITGQVLGVDGGYI